MRQTRMHAKQPMSCPMLDNIDLIDRLVENPAMSASDFALGTAGLPAKRQPAGKLCVIYPFRTA